MEVERAAHLVGGLFGARSKWATCPRAWTLVSVRPAPWTCARSPVKAAMASSAAWIDGPVSWRCQPTNGSAAHIDVIVARHARTRLALRQRHDRGAPGSTVPAGKVKPRKKSIGRRSALAGALSFTSFRPLMLQATNGKRSRPMATVPGGATSCHGRLQHLDVLTIQLERRAGRGDGRRGPALEVRLLAGANPAGLLLSELVGELLHAFLGPRHWPRCSR